ncbi:DUF4191 domain-containing protein [Auritidibacter ignavus]|uniref:DUF4191 domain-containing protein n=1 Tax=Auritidibacter ignavus TaxID=678932 RepID=UPI00109CB4C4|nr:DUF4191 domain-containing protein [Auritidibacter ignavus]
MASDNSSPTKDLKTVKAEQKERRRQQRAEAKANKKSRKKNQDGFFKRIGRVFKDTKEYDPAVVWWMLLGFAVPILIGVILAGLTGNWVTWILIAIPFGLLTALIIMNRRAERAAFARIDGRPGATGAALSTLGRGWVVPQEPVAMNAKSQEAVYRATGKAGVVLVAEGSYNKARQLAEKERRHMSRYLPNVEIRILQVGHGKNEVPLHQLRKTIKRMKKTLNKHEVRAIENRLASLPSNKLPIPKGVDPFKSRPDRRAMRGR